MSRRNFFSSGPLGGRLPTVRLAGQPRARLGQGGGNGCVIPGTQERPVFQYNPTTKVCGVFTMDTSNANYPECVRAPEGYYGGGHNGWIPPSCIPQQASPPAPGGGLPPSVACPMGNGLFTLVSYIDGSLIAENVSRDQFAQYTSDVTDLASGLECSEDSRCAPVCNVSVVQPPSYQGDPPVVPSCCITYWEPSESKWFARCDATAADGTSHGYEGAVDTLPLDHWEGLCSPAAAVIPTPTPTSTTAPASAPVPTSTPGSVTSPAAPVSPGASVPIVPGPFPSAPQPPNLPIASGPIQSSAPPAVPQRGFAPASISPSCKSTPYKVHMFSPTTRATRPDEFAEKQQWTR